jgi:hypothetical protein
LIIEDELSVIIWSRVIIHHIEDVTIRPLVVTEITRRHVDVITGDTILLLVAVVTILLEVGIILHPVVEIIQCREATGTLICLHDVIHQGKTTHFNILVMFG